MPHHLGRIDSHWWRWLHRHHGLQATAVPAATELGASDQKGVSDFASQAATLPAWTTEALADLIKATLEKHGIKMPKLGVPLRVAVAGQKQTPAIDAVLKIMGRDTVLARMEAAIKG